MTTANKGFLAIMLGAAFLLCVPLITRFPWTPIDFIVAGVLLFATGLLCELALRVVTHPIYRIAMCLMILAGLVVVWAELAVGIIGTPFAGS